MCNLKIGSRSDLIERLRRCGTRGDTTLRPYESATIRLERMRIAEMVPLSKYVLQEQLNIVGDLHRRLGIVGVDIFDLASGIMWPEGESERAIACPIIEYWGQEGLLLVDGIHRVWAARDLGRTELTCAIITDVVVPLVPLPITWAEVKLYSLGQRPAEHDKRAYRFLDAPSFTVRISPDRRQGNG